VTPTGPRLLGYYPEMGPTDTSHYFPAVEKIMDLSVNRELVPFLAESVNIDEKKLTMTFKLHKGIRFHDGTELDADTAAWNYRMYFDVKKLQFTDNVKSVEVKDKYTFVLHLSEYNNQMLFAYGWVPIFSKAAFETKGKEWCRLHPVGTGPFKLVEFKRDAYIKWERNPDYWQKGMPYLDGIEERIIPDPVTASSMMQAKEADMWTGAPVKDQADLSKRGLKRQAFWPGLPSMIYLNTANPKAPTANQKVREAIEYAIDKVTMAKALGFGYYTPLKMTAPVGEWGYDPSYQGRSYDPATARRLLSEAGYPNGLKLKLLALQEAGGGRNATAEAVKNYLDEAGFQIDIDIADPGRFYSSLWTNGWDDMALFFTGLDFNYLATVQSWFGHNPKTPLKSLEQPPPFLALSKQSVKYGKVEDQKGATRKLVRMVADDALIIPLFNVPAAYVIQPWVHTDYFRNGLIRWTQFSDWMEKH
jgi:peptide/nickel transport system substrate-binding protein